MAYKPGYVEGKKKIMLYLDNGVARRLKVTAAETDQSMSDIANQAIREAIGMTETVDIRRSYLGAAEDVQDLAGRFTEIYQNLRQQGGRFGDMHYSEWNWADDLPDEIAGRYTELDPAEISDAPDIVSRYRDEQTGEMWEIQYREGYGDFGAVRVDG